MNEINALTKEKLLIRMCHRCHKITEAFAEIERCAHCSKAFLPLRYFEKIHDFKDRSWEKHFTQAELIEEEDLIKGLFVLW